MTLRMTYDPGHHHRQSIRLKGYDYAQAGAYFVTVCTQNRQCIFGHVVGAAACGRAEMVLNDGGRMLQGGWDELQVFYPGLQTDGFVVMPNHVHGIIMLTGRPVRLGPHVGAGPRACPDCASPDIVADHVGQPQAGQPQGVAFTLALSDVVHRFKTITTKRYVDGVKQHGWPPFCGRLWQRNYYEHIIRTEASLNRIREYIANNPAQWALDRENPNVAGAVREQPQPEDEQ